jgi:CRISPR/Cas system-associated exonuclease Cas4 (RecB family)
MSVALERVSKEEVMERLHISYSQLKTFLMCPQKYFFQYVIGAEWERKSAALPFGSAIHKAVESYYRSLQEMGEILSVDVVVDVFDRVLEEQILNSQVEIIFKDGEDFASLRKQGAELLKVFLAEVKPQKIVGIEVPFSVKIADLTNSDGFLPIRLVGILDLVESDSDGSYLVVDLKTSSQRYSELKLKHDIQSTVYSFAMVQMGLATSENDSTLVRFDVLLKQKTVGFEKYFVSRTKDDHRRLIQLMNQIHRAIELRVFYRQNGWQCQDCPFGERCVSDV